jgi:hypothetical protein
MPEFRYLSDVGRDPPRFVAQEQISGSAPTGLLLEINVGKRCPLRSGTIKQASISSPVQGGGKRREPGTSATAPHGAPIFFRLSSHRRRGRVLDLEPMVDFYPDATASSPPSIRVVASTTAAWCGRLNLKYILLGAAV